MPSFMPPGTPRQRVKGRNTRAASSTQVSTAKSLSTRPARNSPIKLNENAHSAVTRTRRTIPPHLRYTGPLLYRFCWHYPVRKAVQTPISCPTANRVPCPLLTGTTLTNQHRKQHHGRKPPTVTRSQTAPCSPHAGGMENPGHSGRADPDCPGGTDGQWGY